MIKLKSLITEQEQFKAKSKETGRVVVYKSKDSMDKAIKGGTAEPLDKKTSGKPEKVKGADLFKKDKPKLDPKQKQRAQDDYNDAIRNIKNPLMAGGIEPYYVDMAADNLKKLGNPDAKVFKDLGKEFRDNLDDDGNPKDEKLDKQIQDKIKQAALDLETDITKDLPFPVGTKVKDGKIKSSGPQRFADDVKDMKGEYDLDGGVKIKDGKMFDADGEEMDADDIEDFYYQDAYDGMGINVGIDIKKTSKPEKDDDEPEEPYDLSDFDPREDVKKNESLNEQGVLSRRAGIKVFGDKKLELISKSLIHTARDLHHTAKRKDEKNFDDVLSRITITLGVIRSYLNKPKRRM